MKKIMAINTEEAEVHVYDRFCQKLTLPHGDRLYFFEEGTNLSYLELYFKSKGLYLSLDRRVYTDINDRLVVVVPEEDIDYYDELNVIETGEMLEVCFLMREDASPQVIKTFLIRESESRPGEYFVQCERWNPRDRDSASMKTQILRYIWTQMSDQDSDNVEDTEAHDNWLYIGKYMFEKLCNIVPDGQYSGAQKNRWKGLGLWPCFN